VKNKKWEKRRSRLSRLLVVYQESEKWKLDWGLILKLGAAIVPILQNREEKKKRRKRGGNSTQGAKREEASGTFFAMKQWRQKCAWKGKKKELSRGAVALLGEQATWRVLSWNSAGAAREIGASILDPKKSVKRAGGSSSSVMDLCPYV